MHGCLSENKTIHHRPNNEGYHHAPHGKALKATRPYRGGHEHVPVSHMDALTCCGLDRPDKNTDVNCLTLALGANIVDCSGVPGKTLQP
eukprot:5574732-Alexandrium_andersonii.AAC.1